MLKVELYFRSLSAKKEPNLIKIFIHYLLQDVIISDHLVMLTIRNNANSRKKKKIKKIQIDAIACVRKLTYLLH